jgi:hypothetical protein
MFPICNHDFYFSRLPLSEYEKIVNWEALRKNKVVAAVGKRCGAPGVFEKKLRTLRNEEIYSGFDEFEVAAYAALTALTANANGANVTITPIDHASMPTIIPAKVIEYIDLTKEPIKMELDSTDGCAICMMPMVSPYMGRCSHVFCKSCLCHASMKAKKYSEKFAGSNHAIDGIQIEKCPSCRTTGMVFYKML